MGIEGAGEGGAERRIEGATRLGAEGDVRFKRFSSTENISYSTRRALRVRQKKGGRNNAEVETSAALWENNVGAHRGTLVVSDFGGGLEEETGSLSGRKDDIYVSGLCCGV